MRAARRLRALPRRDRRDQRPRRAAGGLRSAPAAPASRSCCGRRSGRTRARRRTRSPTCRCARSTATRTRSPPTARTSPPTCAPRAPAARSSRRPRASTTPSGRAPARPNVRPPYQALFAGRLSREKGVCVLLRAWPLAGLSAPSTALVLVGDGPIRARAVAAGAAHLEARWSRSACATSTRAATLWWCRPIPTRDFLEPWGLVVNEAFDQGVPVIATDAVGAAAGGLVRTSAPASSCRRATRGALAARAAAPARRPGAARAARRQRARGGPRPLPRRLGGRA